MTRQTFLTRVRQMSDTLDSQVDYPDELLKDFGGMVHVDEWRRLLDIAPYYRTNRVSVALDANGRFAWSALTTGSGNSVKRVYRVLELSDAEQNTLTFAQADRLRLAGARVATSERLWTKVGDEVQTFGCTGTLDALVNWTPCSVSDLTSDADVVDYPEEYKPILFYETAALALAKGGRETSEATDLIRMADMMRQKAFASLRREASTPFILGADDHPWEWGG